MSEVVEVTGSVITFGDQAYGTAGRVFRYADVQIGANVVRIGRTESADLSKLALKGDHVLELELGAFKSELTVRLAGARPALAVKVA